MSAEEKISWTRAHDLGSSVGAIVRYVMASNEGVVIRPAVVVKDLGDGRFGLRVFCAPSDIRWLRTPAGFTGLARAQREDTPYVEATRAGDGDLEPETWI